MTSNFSYFARPLRTALLPLVAALVLAGCASTGEVSTGAGSEMRKAMGVAVFAGMIGVTAFGLFLTPVFYVVLRRLAGNRPLTQHGEGTMSPSPSPSQAPPAVLGGGGSLHAQPAAPHRSHE